MDEDLGCCNRVTDVSIGPATPRRMRGRSAYFSNPLRLAPKLISSSAPAATYPVPKDGGRRRRASLSIAGTLGAGERWGEGGGGTEDEGGRKEGGGRRFTSMSFHTRTNCCTPGLASENGDSCFSGLVF